MLVLTLFITKFRPMCFTIFLVGLIYEVSQCQYLTSHLYLYPDFCCFYHSFTADEFFGLPRLVWNFDDLFLLF